MTKLEELARSLHDKWPYNSEAELQTDILTALKPLLDAAESARLLLATEKLLHLVPEFGEQLSRWRKK